MHTALYCTVDAYCTVLYCGCILHCTVLWMHTVLYAVQVHTFGGLLWCPAAGVTTVSSTAEEESGGMMRE